jgi:hypothetical protein
VNPLEQNPRARQVAYQVFWVASLIVGAVQVGFAAANAASPTWLLVVLSVLPFIGAGIGYTAQANVNPYTTPKHAAGPQDPDRLPERGAYDTHSLLIALACIVVIAVGVVWLVRSF